MIEGFAFFLVGTTIGGLIAWLGFQSHIRDLKSQLEKHQTS